MIDIKGLLKNKHAQISSIVWTYIVVYIRFSPDWFWILILDFPQVSVVLFWFVIFTRSGDERMRLWNSLSRDGWYLLFCFRYDTDIFKPSIIGNIISNYTHLILGFKAMFFLHFIGLFSFTLSETKYIIIVF